MKDKSPADFSNNERLDVGPLTFEQDHSNLKKEIDDSIQKLISQIKQYDPRNFLVSISKENCTCDAEFLSGSLSEGSEVYAEYALSLALTEPFFESRPPPPEDELVKFSKNITSIVWKVSWYFLTEILDESCNIDSHKYRISSIMKLLFERGDSEEVHHLDLISGLFEPHKEFLINSIGFDINQIISYISEIQDQITSNLSIYGLSKKPNFTCNIFEIFPNERLPIKFIELISVPFGKNSDFVNGSDGNYGWPTNISIIEKYPVTSYNEKYYCFVPQLLFRNVIGILERWIFDDHNSYYQGNYQKQKGEYLENKSLEYISDLLPEADVYQNLYYKNGINGQKNKTETDGIVIYDNNLFIIEAKSGQFHQFARRGNVEKIKSEIKKLIAGAYTQALGTKEFFLRTSQPVFTDKKGKIVYKENDSSRFRNVFLINITLENLGSLSTHLNSLRRSGLIEGREWPWSVNLNDLRVISELNETPSEFLLYLQQRLRVNDSPDVQIYDELELFGCFLNEGINFEDSLLDNSKKIVLNGYTYAIDCYYHSQMGLVSSGEKPTFNIPSEFKNLIKSIENTRKFGFTYVTTTLLGFDSETHQEILKRIDSMSEQVDDDGRCHTTTFLFNDKKLGLTIVIDNSIECDPSEYHTYAELKKYQTRFDVWIILVIKKSKKQIENVNFEMIEMPWKYSIDLQNDLKKNPLSLEGAHPDTGRKIGRNETCPCGSGVKFKKCCGKVIGKVRDE